MPTYTVLLAQNNVQQGVNNNHPRRRRRTDRHPGTHRHRDPADGWQGNALATGTADGQLRRHHVHRHDPVDADRPAGRSPSRRTYTPASGGQLASTSADLAAELHDGATRRCSMRWPDEPLRRARPPCSRPCSGAGIPDGSVAFTMDGVGHQRLDPDHRTASPPSSGRPRRAECTRSPWPTPAPPQPKPARFVQRYLQPGRPVQPARAVDNITVDPPGQPAWSIAQPISPAHRIDRDPRRHQPVGDDRCCSASRGPA